MPSFELVHVSGEELGVRRLGDVTWKPGDLIPIGDGGQLRVVEVQWKDDEGDVAGVLVVEAVV